MLDMLFQHADVITMRDEEPVLKNVAVGVKNGRIAQQGTHRELMAQPGYYREQDEFQRLQARLETVA